MVNKPSQNDRVVALLKARGSDGVDQTMFYAPHTFDGGPPITRLAARINDLRKRGYVISSQIRPGHGPLAVYVLTSSPADTTGPTPAEIADAARARAALEQREREETVVVETYVRRKRTPTHNTTPVPAAALTLFDQAAGAAPARTAVLDEETRAA